MEFGLEDVVHFRGCYMEIHVHSTLAMAEVGKKER